MLNEPGCACVEETVLLHVWEYLGSRLRSVRLHLVDDQDRASTPIPTPSSTDVPHTVSSMREPEILRRKSLQ